MFGNLIRKKIMLIDNFIRNTINLLNLKIYKSLIKKLYY